MPDLWDALMAAAQGQQQPSMWPAEPAAAPDSPQQPLRITVHPDRPADKPSLWEGLTAPDERGLQPPPTAEMRSYTPSWAERIKGGVSDVLRGLGADAYNAGKYGDVVKTAAQFFPPTGIPLAVNEMQRGVDAGSPLDVGMAAAGVIPGVKPELMALRKGIDAAKAATPAVEKIAARAAVPEIQGSLNPLDNVDVYFRGKQPKDFTPDDWEAFGKHYGADNIGPLSPLQTFKDMHGNEFQVPGGTEGKWTYLDALHMKANPINPANVDRQLHTAMQNKLGRTMTPTELSDADVWNGLMFGMTSPNNPLFPNQLSASRLRLRTPQMLDDLASMIPWKAGQSPTEAARKIVSDQIAQRFGLQAAPKGGLGVRGTTDYSRVGELAQMFKENPAFFRKRPDESWLQAVERISSQVPGLSMKTGSLGTVWQDPAKAAISAIDRHMARELDKQGGIFASPAERADWQDRGVNLWNKRETDRVAEQKAANAELPRAERKKVEPKDTAKTFTDLLTKSGSDGFIGEMLLSHVGKASNPLFRLASGEINPQLPPHLATAAWAREPKKVLQAGRAYKQALDVNQGIADKHGLNLFMSQWMEWDRIRNRFEPHENMFPGLSKLPAPSVNQLRDVNKAHAETGHKTYGKDEEATMQPTRPLIGPASRMGYLGLGGAALAPALFGEDRR